MQLPKGILLEEAIKHNYSVELSTTNKADLTSAFFCFRTHFMPSAWTPANDLLKYIRKS